MLVGLCLVSSVSITGTSPMRGLGPFGGTSPLQAQVSEISCGDIILATWKSQTHLANPDIRIQDRS